MRFSKKHAPTTEESAAMALNYLCNELRSLSATYEVQYAAMEDFARWNLPEETGLTWIDYRDCLFSSLKEFPYVPEEAMALAYQISKNFDEAFDLEQREYEALWSHEGMKNHPFWENQRNLAKQALSLFER